MAVSIDSICVEIKDESNKEITTGLTYTPVQTPEVGERLYDQSAEICKERDSIMMGLLYTPISIWGESPPSSSGRGLDLNLLDTTLIKFVEKPTCDKRLLDLVPATNEDLVVNGMVGEKFGTSVD